MIKYTVLILLLALASAQSGYTPEDKGATNIKGKLSLEFGAQFVVQKAIHAHEIPPGEYKVDKINSANVDLNNSERKTFDVQLVATNGKTSLRAFYCVMFDSTTNTHQVIYYGFVAGSNLRSVVFSAEDSQEVTVSELELHLLDLYNDTEQVINDDRFTAAALLVYNGEEWIVGEAETEHEMIFDSPFGDMVAVDITQDNIIALNYDQDLQMIFLPGLDQALNSIFNDPNNTSIQGSTNSQFRISRIFGIKDFSTDSTTLYNKLGYGDFYEFDVEVHNEQGVRLRIIFRAHRKLYHSFLNGVDVFSYRFRPVNAESSQ